MGFLKSLFGGGQPKTPPTPPVVPKYQLGDYHLVRLGFDSDQAAQQRTKDYVYRQVADFRTTKDVSVRWAVRRLRNGNVGLFLGRTMMIDVTPNELLEGILARAASMGAPLMLEGQYVWDRKSGPFGAHLFLPRDPASVEMLTVS